MAQFGAQYPCFAPFSGDEPAAALPTYGGKVVLGKLVSAKLTINLASGELYADDELAEQVSEFASGTLALETDDMTDDVAAAVYGATKAATPSTDKSVTYSKADSPPLGGLAYYKVLMRIGTKIYKGYYYPKTKAALGNDNAQTRGNNITFGTTSTTFTIFSCNTGAWRITEELTTEAAAKEWVNNKLGEAS